MAISSYQVTLAMGEKVTGSGQQTYGTTVVIKDFPDLIGDPNLLETTTLSDDAQTFIPGIKTVDMLQFTLNWDKTACGTIKADEIKNMAYKLTFSDTTAFTWEGKHTLGIPGKGVDEVLEATLNVVPSTVITVAFPSN